MVLENYWLSNTVTVVNSKGLKIFGASNNAKVVIGVLEFVTNFEKSRHSIYIVCRLIGGRNLHSSFNAGLKTSSSYS